VIRTLVGPIMLLSSNLHRMIACGSCVGCQWVHAPPSFTLKLPIFQAMGADICNSARGMMFALGCVQALKCNTNKCPTGIATQNKDLMAGLDVKDKSYRVANFQRKTVHSALEIAGVCCWRRCTLMWRVAVTGPCLILAGNGSQKFDQARAWYGQPSYQCKQNFDV